MSVDAKGKVAARRDGAFPNEINGPARPTAENTPLDLKGDFPGLSNGKQGKSLLSRNIPDRHKRASKALGLALFQGTDTAWRLTAEIWHLRLTADERYSMAVAALASLAPDDMVEAVTAVLGGAGMPLPSFLEPLDEAQWWADLASPAELDAYLVAIFAALPRRKQRDFIEYAQGVTA